MVDRRSPISFVGWSWTGDGLQKAAGRETNATGRWGLKEPLPYRSSTRCTLTACGPLELLLT